MIDRFNMILVVGCCYCRVSIELILNLRKYSILNSFFIKIITIIMCGFCVQRSSQCEYRDSSVMFVQEFVLNVLL